MIRYKKEPSSSGELVWKLWIISRTSYPAFESPLSVVQYLATSSVSILDWVPCFFFAALSRRFGMLCGYRHRDSFFWLSSAQYFMRATLLSCINSPSRPAQQQRSPMNLLFVFVGQPWLTPACRMCHCCPVQGKGPCRPSCASSCASLYFI